MKSEKKEVEGSGRRGVLERWKETELKITPDPLTLYFV